MINISWAPEEYRNFCSTPNKNFIDYYRKDEIYYQFIVHIKPDLRRWIETSIGGVAE